VHQHINFLSVSQTKYTSTYWKLAMSYPNFSRARKIHLCCAFCPRVRRPGRPSHRHCPPTSQTLTTRSPSPAPIGSWPPGLPADQSRGPPLAPARSTSTRGVPDLSTVMVQNFCCFFSWPICIGIRIFGSFLSSVFSPYTADCFVKGTSGCPWSIFREHNPPLWPVRAH